MASRSESLGERIKDSLKFWLVVVVLCAIIFGAAYYFGRNYVGRHLHEMEVTQRAPEIVPQSGTAEASDDDGDAGPPLRPVVVMTEREPTSREERRARRELSRPQDGAQLHAAEADEESDEESDEAGETDQPDALEQQEPQDAARETGEQAETGEPVADERYVVSAGSFADESNAERQVQRLTERGYQPYVTVVEKEDITYRRVNVGVFEEREQADRVKQRLLSEGFDAAVWTEQG